MFFNTVFSVNIQFNLKLFYSITVFVLMRQIVPKIFYSLRKFFKLVSRFSFFFFVFFFQNCLDSISPIRGFQLDNISFFFLVKLLIQKFIFYYLALFFVFPSISISLSNFDFCRILEENFRRKNRYSIFFTDVNPSKRRLC